MSIWVVVADMWTEKSSKVVILVPVYQNFVALIRIVTSKNTIKFMMPTGNPNDKKPGDHNYRYACRASQNGALFKKDGTPFSLVAYVYQSNHRGHLNG